MLGAVTTADKVSIADGCSFVSILCRIDEIHTLVGAGAVGRGGGGGGGLDISNLMKPALARGELQCIGATTLDEHRKHIEKDQALER
jgi:ATP-dependent Clp protease ATP-binding subunit ClpC